MVGRGKLKNSNEPESCRFSSEGYSSEFDGFSLASVDHFLDFDCIKDWIVEMQAPDSVESDKAEIGNDIGDESCLENPIDNCFVQDMDSRVKSGSVKIECGGTVEHIVVNEDRVINGDDSMLISDGIKGSCMVNFVKADLGIVEPAETNYNADHAENRDQDEPGTGMLDDRSCEKIESFGCSIEEGLEKVTLVGGGDLVFTRSGMSETGATIVSDDMNSDSESECETSSSSSSTPSSGSESSDDDEEEEEINKEVLCNIKRGTTEQRVDTEEGQIIDSDEDKMVSLSENDEVDANEHDEDFELGDDADDNEGDDDLVKGPIKSKNELQVLPPVPPVDVTLQPCHQILPVGIVSSVLGAQVIVEGSEKHNPLSEGSILWIAERRLPLGLVDEIFGPVKTPYYIVRYNSESEVPSDIQNGTMVGFVPEFVDHILNDKNLYQKGYDASGENDEELLDEVEFSDDEKEAEYRRMLKFSKRGNNQGQGPGNKKKNRRNIKNRDKTWTKDQLSASQSPTVQPSQPDQMQHRVRAPVPSSSQGNPSCSSPIGQVFAGGPTVKSLGQGNQSGSAPAGLVFPGGPTVQSLGQGNQSGSAPVGPVFPSGLTAFPQQVQPAGLLLNSLFQNGMPFQQQTMALSGGFQINGIPWLQQNPLNPQMPSAAPTPWQQQQHVSQFPLTNAAPPQRPFDLSHLVPTNFAAGPANSPWLGLLGQNIPNQAVAGLGLQGPTSQLPLFPGILSSAPQPAQSSNSQAATSSPGNAGISPQFNLGFSGRGRGRKPFHHRGGHFRGGRGRYQS